MTTWITRVGRFLSFSWRSGTTGTVDEAAAETALENALQGLKSSFPELKNAKNAKVNSKPHPTSKADGRIDPLHVSFKITDDKDQPITSAHAYLLPLGGRKIWFSKPKYNNNQTANQHFPPDPDFKK